MSILASQNKTKNKSYLVNNITQEAISLSIKYGDFSVPRRFLNSIQVKLRKL